MYAKREELKKIPYITNIPSDGRFVFLLPFIDKNDNKFKMHVPHGNGLTWIYAEPQQSCYYAEEISDKSRDIYLKIVDLVVQHYSFKSVVENLFRIINDIMNCSTVVEKSLVFLNLFRQTQDISIHNMIETELEYLFANIRSLYDLSELLIRDLWKINGSGDELPTSFFDMVKLDSAELQKKYGLPQPLIEYYSKSKDFFIACRDIRDNIFHSWNHSGLKGEIGVVFCLDEGFALQKNSVFSPNPVTKEFDIWPQEKTKENGLVSVLALISYMNNKVIDNLEELSCSLILSIKPYLPISATHKVFLRGPYVHHLVESVKYLNVQWIEEAIVYRKGEGTTPFQV